MLEGVQLRATGEEYHRHRDVTIKYTISLPGTNAKTPWLEASLRKTLGFCVGHNDRTLLRHLTAEITPCTIVAILADVVLRYERGFFSVYEPLPNLSREASASTLDVVFRDWSVGNRETRRTAGRYTGGFGYGYRTNPKGTRHLIYVPDPAGDPDITEFADVRLLVCVSVPNLTAPSFPWPARLLRICRHQSTSEGFQGGNHGALRGCT